MTASSEIEPIAVRLRDAPRYCGLSRSELYRRAAAGELEIRKSGRTGLVLTADLRRLVETAPLAKIRRCAKTA